MLAEVHNKKLKIKSQSSLVPTEFTFKNVALSIVDGVLLLALLVIAFFLKFLEQFGCLQASKHEEKRAIKKQQIVRS